MEKPEEFECWPDVLGVLRRLSATANQVAEAATKAVSNGYAEPRPNARAHARAYACAHAESVAEAYTATDAYTRAVTAGMPSRAAEWYRDWCRMWSEDSEMLFGQPQGAKAGAREADGPEAGRELHSWEPEDQDPCL